ncbi:hypothetical protein C8N40_11623 [Pontibacter mucosus]|uniref:Uncharacterized protein n=1 Tax=Pontibacter mucosus TaxID=1649266 RepID=A0A2T5Y3D3_9BACT|nr:hypothetical protein C8N40_11623 [Pontibacter mucosus]
MEASCLIFWRNSSVLFMHEVKFKAILYTCLNQDFQDEWIYRIYTCRITPYRWREFATRAYYEVGFVTQLA